MAFSSPTPTAALSCLTCLVLSFSSTSRLHLCTVTQHIEQQVGNHHMWLASRKIWSVEELETLPAGTKPRTSHHRSPGGERREKSKRWTIFLDRQNGRWHTQSVGPRRSQHTWQSWTPWRQTPPNQADQDPRTVSLKSPQILVLAKMMTLIMTMKTTMIRIILTRTS